eukprot:7829735-Pyramimonas_sp.AAC.1
MGSSTEAPGGAAHMRPTRLIWYFNPPSAALRGLIGATARVRPPPALRSAPWPHRELHRRKDIHNCGIHNFIWLGPLPG